MEGERLRIYWEGMPIWGKLSPLSNLFLELQHERRGLDLLQQLDLRGPRPGRSLPQHGPGVQQHLHLPLGDPRKRRTSSAWSRLYKIDGILYHDAKTCPNNSNSRYGLPQRIEQKLGLPYLIINGDLNDLRMYSEEQTRTNIEAFVEQMTQGR